LAVAFLSVASTACAQTAAPAPPEPPAATAPEPQRAAEAEVEAAHKIAAEARLQAQNARAHAEMSRQDAHRALTLAFAGKKEKVAFIGVSTTPVDAALRENLNLQRGVGLVVETVEKDSPAEKAGLLQYDILQKLDDQLLVNSQQLGVLTRLHKPGDEVTLTVLRKGQPQQLKVSLIEKEVRVSEDGMFGSMAPRVFTGEAVPAVPEIANKLNWIRMQPSNSSANYIFQDGESTLEITRKDNSKHLTAKDKDGKVLFDGAIDTDEQRKAIPEDVSKKLAKLETRMKALPQDAENADVKVRVLEEP
jgi:hypothetical protein